MAKKKKKHRDPKGVVTGHGPAPTQPPPKRAKKEDPWVWVEGLHPLGFWQPLYNFRKTELMRARGTLKHILRMDRPGPELVLYDDFRLNMGDLEAFEFEPSPEVRAKFVEMSTQRAPQRFPRSRSMVGDALEAPDSQNGSQSPTEPRSTCSECRDEDPNRSCVRKQGHSGLHRDAEGKKWRSS